MVKYITIRLGILCTGLLAFEWIYSRWLYESDLQRHAPIIEKIRSVTAATTILYVGESSNVTCGKMDVDKRPIHLLVNDYFPELVVSDITQPASHAGIYKTILAHVSEEIQTLVVTVNLRSFNAEWRYSGLETPMQKEVLLLDNGPALFNRFRLSFKDYPVYTERERHDLIHDEWRQPLDFLQSRSVPFQNLLEWRDWYKQTSRLPMEEKQLGAQFITTYAFEIDTVNNSRLADLEAIVDLAESKNWNLIFHILAENVERASELVGPDLVSVMYQNSKKVYDYFHRRGVTIIDNLAAVPDAYFLDKSWPTEHYSEEGRKILAKNIAMAVQHYHVKAFRVPIKNKSTQHIFMNDCEGTTKWGLEGEITQSDAHSGKSACITGPNHHYGLSFDHPFTAIPDSTKNDVTIRMWIKGEVITDEMRLVLDIDGDEIERHWRSVSLNELSTNTDEWQEIRYTFPLEKKHAKGYLIHIYPYNPTEHIMYVDDIEIHFH